MSEPRPAAAKLARLHDLDAMRSILMMLGVVLHAANPYKPGSTWLVADAATSPTLAAVVDFIHLFRMPAFFVVAGFFAMHSLIRRKTSAFLSERMIRLLVPFIATLVTLNLLQAWILLPSPKSPDAFLSAVVVDWRDGRLMGHLWFLIDLAVYCLIAAILADPLRRFGHLHWPVPERATRTVRLIIAVAAGLGLCVASIETFAPAWFHGYIVGFIEPTELLEYSLFFIVGLALYGRPDLLTQFSNPRSEDVGVGLGLATLWLLIAPGDSSPIVASKVLAHWLIVWTLVRICFAAFRRWASAPSPTFLYLSDASYSVYLFHHIVVVLIASSLLPWHQAAWVKFVIVSIVAMVSTLVVHHFLVLRSPLLRLLFNGTRKKFPIAATR